MSTKTIMNCTVCARAFLVKQYLAGLTQNVGRQNIFCPYCSTLMRGRDDLVYVTFPLTLVEESRFKRRNARSDPDTG